MERHLNIARTLTRLLDNQFDMGGFKFGLDPIIGLVPVLGDILPAGVSAYLIWVAYKLGLPREKLLKMALISIADIGIGFVPVLGDFVDISYKSYQRSLDIIEEYLKSFESRVIEGEFSKSVNQ